MRICYLGRRAARRNSPPEGNDDVLELLWDNWDDHGYKTSFIPVCRVNGEIVDIGTLRLLVEGSDNSYAALDGLLKSGWDGTFPAPGINYISVPSEITFYQQLKASLDVNVAIQVAESLRDASHLQHNLDTDAITLIGTNGFEKSLQRERGSISAYLDGWKILDNQAIAVEGFEFHFQDVFNDISTIALNFDSENVFPHEVNILIGPNGTGKSQILHQMVESWIRPEDSDIGFAEKPNLSQLVVVSYSPFERFPVDMQGLRLRDTDVYRYFGFRGRSASTTEGRPGKIRLSHEFPRRDAEQSLIACLADDQKYKAITDWARKVSTMEEVLRTAFQFDFAAIEIEPHRRVRSLYTDFELVTSPTSIEHEKGTFIPITPHTARHLNAARLSDVCIPGAGVTFFKEDEEIELSSGQRLFAYIVINLLGVIRRNSLVLIDEPELFLHPTLEIQFIEMLKEVLASFNSKALLATHSEVIVREIPSECVHVMHRAEDRIVISNPPFQTFGGDIQRISSYVFGDNAVSKPFEKWLEKKFYEFGSSDALIEAMGDNINEELIIQIKAMQGNNPW